MHMHGFGLSTNALVPDSCLQHPHVEDLLSIKYKFNYAIIQTSAVSIVLTLSLAALVVFIGRIVPENSLFCSHPDLLHTMTDSPTPFCVISGKHNSIIMCNIMILNL